MTNSLAIDSGALAIPEPDARGVRVYKGIPCAAPPVGPLRWRPPEPVAAWTGVRPTHAFGMNALQGVLFNDIDPTVPGISEDCLTLNIWTPAAPGEAMRLPAMVWIHGGGSSVGSGAEPRYDGARLAARGVLVVTLNHRLNALGFLAHPELTAESEHRASGNYGLLDLVAALQWVKRNIAAFGGDPDQITIAGESAGSESVSALMASPLAKGLFARAIGQSGALFASPLRTPPTLAKAEAAGLDLMHNVGATTLAELRAVPGEAILAAAPGLGFRPIVDGWFLPRPPADIFAAGEQSDVPLMAGWNKDEGFNFPLGAEGERRFADLVGGLFGERAGEALALYPAGSLEGDDASARALGGDLIIIHPTWAWIEAQKQSGRADIFRFRFDRAPLTPQGWFGERDSKTAGAFHAGEIPYVFDNLGAVPWLIVDHDVTLADLASSYWVNFIKTGDPNGSGLPSWPSHRGAEAPVMALDVSAAAAPEEGRAQHAFLESVVTERRKAERMPEWRVIPSGGHTPRRAKE
jgi:para-nitrobenzyl esterase